MSWTPTRNKIFAILFVIGGCGNLLPQATRSPNGPRPFTSIGDRSCKFLRLGFCAGKIPWSKTRRIAAVIVFLWNSIWFYLIYWRKIFASHSQKSSDVPLPPQTGSFSCGDRSPIPLILKLPGCGFSLIPRTRKRRSRRRNCCLEFHGSARVFSNMDPKSVPYPPYPWHLFGVGKGAQKAIYGLPHNFGGHAVSVSGQADSDPQRMVDRGGRLSGLLHVESFFHFPAALCPGGRGGRAPWIMVRSPAFNARDSAFRNMTFRFDGRHSMLSKCFMLSGGCCSCLPGGVHVHRARPRKASFPCRCGRCQPSSSLSCFPGG